MTEFDLIVEDIIKDIEFQKLKEIEHHHGSRYDHLLKVAKKSYEIAKRNNLDYVSCARAGVLHDFFESYDNKLLKTRIYLICNHGKNARMNSERFNLNDKERNIIESHMFPLGLVLPKSREALIVSIVDKTLAFSEYFSNFRYKNAFTLMTLILFISRGI